VPIYFFNDDFKFSLKGRRTIRNWLTQIIENSNYSVGEINIIFTSENRILSINREYLNHNYLTDIITFPYTTGNIVSSDIYICIPVVKFNAHKFNQLFSQELNRVIVHGVLHLIGYNDSTENQIKQMRKAEDDCLLKLKEINNAKRV